MSFTQEFQNDNITVVVTREPGCRVKFDIAISAQATQAAFQKALKTINKDVSLPGFRKGKAPEQIVLQKYAKFVEQEWQDLIVKTAFQDALQLTEIQPLNQESIRRPQLKKHSKEEGSHMIIEFETLPEIPQFNFKDIALKPPKRKKIGKKEVENAIMDLRLHHATWNEIADRAIKEGDYIRADIDNIDDPENPICRDTLFQIKKGIVAKWMHDLLIGKNKGDVVEGYSEKDELLPEEGEFVKTHCRINVKSIQHPNLPELDDEFGKKLGLTQIDQLAEKVEADLNRQADESVQESLRGQVDDALLNLYPIDVPSSLFDAEKKSRMQRISQIKRQMKPESYEKIKDRYSDEKINDSVVRTLRLYFLTRAFASTHEIGITQDEIVQEMMLHMYNPNSTLINPSMDNEEIRSKLYLSILDRKTKDYIIDKVITKKD